MNCAHKWRRVDLGLVCDACGYVDQRPLPFPHADSAIEAWGNGFTLGMRAVENDELLPDLRKLL